MRSVTRPWVACWDQLGYALHVNAKKLEASARHPDRNAQFEHIATERAAFAAAGVADHQRRHQRRSWIGDFKNAGAAWRLEAAAVNAHDFPSDAQGRAVPYGIYDVTHNQGTVDVGASADTPQFAVDVIARWWTTIGQVLHGPAQHLLILGPMPGAAMAVAPASGSTNCRNNSATAFSA